MSNAILPRSSGWRQRSQSAYVSWVMMRIDGSRAAARAIASACATGQCLSTLAVVTRAASTPMAPAPASAISMKIGRTLDRACDSGDQAVNAAGNSTAAAIGSQTTLRDVSRPTSSSSARQSASKSRSLISGRRIATSERAANRKKAGHARRVVPAHSVTSEWNAPFVAVAR